MAVETGTATKLYGKNGDLKELLAPETAASQVLINDEDGNASTVEKEIEALRKFDREITNEGVRFKGTVSSTSGLPTVSYKSGWQYLVAEAGTYAGKTCEVGDMILCVKDYASGSASNNDWTVTQANITGAVTGPASSVTAHVAVFDGTSGKQIRDSGFTIAKSVPGNAVFTDTTYSPATDEADGLLTASLHSKLVGIEAGADKTDAANVAAAGAFMVSSNTADDLKDGSSKVVMTSSERTKLAGVATGAEVNQSAWSKVKVGTATLSATAKTDTLELAAGSGITMSASGKKVTVAESYVDSCLVTSLDDVPANLRDGGIILLKG